MWSHVLTENRQHGYRLACSFMCLPCCCRRVYELYNNYVLKNPFYEVSLLVEARFGAACSSRYTSMPSTIRGWTPFLHCQGRAQLAVRLHAAAILSQVEMPVRCELFDTNLATSVAMLHRRWGIATQ